jgi:hypothetical protein
MPDEQEKPEEQQVTEIEALPGESFHARLKRISQMPRKAGESRFVKIRGGIGPMSFIPLPNIPDADDSVPLPEDGPETAEEHFRIEMERRRRQSLGLAPGPVTEEHFRSKKH